MTQAANIQENKDQNDNSKPKRRRRSRHRSRSGNGSNNATNSQRSAQHKPKAGQNKSAMHRKKHEVARSKPQKEPIVTSKEVTELLLPSAASLHEFEFAVEGGAERLLEIAKAEQTHRHQWEDYALKSQVKSQRLGLLFASILGLVTLFLVKGFADAGKDELAQIVSISVFGAMALAVIANCFFSKK